MSSDTYSLLTEPWIPVDRGGAVHAPEHVGITDALLHAHELRLAVDALDGTVLLRLLAAVLDAAAGPTTTAEWDAAWRAPALPADRITTYLHDRRDRFDLRDPDRPFGQCAALTTPNRTNHALRPASWAGTSGRFFDADVLTRPALPLAPADAALALLRLQAIHPGGIQTAHPADPRGSAGKVYGGRPGPLSLVTHLHVTSPGARLKDELLLALPPQPRATGDAPAWERECPGPAGVERTPTGRLDLWTWPTRRARLIHGEGAVTGLALHDGDRDPGKNTVTTLNTLDPMVARTPKGGCLPLTDRARFATPWAAALLLDRDDIATASPVLHHTLEAARRHVLAPDMPLVASCAKFEHTTAHRAAIASVVELTTELGTAGVLATDEGRGAIAAAARLPHEVQRVLYSTTAKALGQRSDDVAARQDLSLTRRFVDGSWTRLARDPRRNMDAWIDAVGEALHATLVGVPARGPMGRAQISVELDAALDRCARLTLETLETVG